jgi:hypothetical protein
MQDKPSKTTDLGGSLHRQGSGCRCVWKRANYGKHWTIPCQAADNGSWLCQRPKGHGGDHVACTPGRHNLHRWPNVADHRPGATDSWNMTEASSPGSVHLFCWAKRASYLF